MVSIQHTRQKSTSTSAGNKVNKLCYTAAEACALLSISPKTLTRLSARGCLKSLKALRTRLYPASELLRFVEESR